MIAAYKPDKTREVGVKMSIVLYDDEPVYQKARRLSEAEKLEVNTQVDDSTHHEVDGT